MINARYFGAPFEMFVEQQVWEPVKSKAAVIDGGFVLDCLS